MRQLTSAPALVLALGAALLLLPAGPARADVVIERTVAEFGPKPEEPEKKAQERFKGEAPPAAPAGVPGGAPAAVPEKAPAGETPGTVKPKPEIVRLSRLHYTVKMAPGKLRETCQETGLVTIVDSDVGVVWLIDPAEKNYREIKFRELTAAAADSRSRLERRLPLISDDEERKQLAALLKSEGQSPEVVVSRPGETRKILDEECDLVVVKVEGQELFRSFVARRPAPAMESRWLRAGGLLSEGAARKLSEIKGLVLEATYRLPEGGRVEVTTDRLSESDPVAGDYDDPAKLNYARVGGPAKLGEKKPAEKDKKPAPPAPPAKPADGPKAKPTGT